MLRIDPDQTCYTSDHWIMVVMASLGIIVYVIGIPAGMCVALLKYREQNKLKDCDVLTTLGFLYTDFEPGFWYWSIWICVRRFVLCMLMICLYTVPQFQLACGMILAIASICMQYFCRPYKRASLDVLDSVSSFVPFAPSVFCTFLFSLLVGCY